MGKKKSCQNVKVPRPLSAVEQGLYGWVEETIFTQPSVLEDSLPELRRRMSLTKRNNLTYDLFHVKMKKTKLDRMMAMMADPSRMAPRAILPTGVASATAAAAATSSSNPATPAAQVPPPPPTNSKAKKSSAKRERPEAVNVEGEEGAREDPTADLKQKRRWKDKGKEEDFVDRVLGEDSAWEHAVNPLDLVFPKEYNYRKALDGG
ncbi:hypothetical protein PIB30_067042 [Stylosanthes scabra]|uniref:Uncharacterized protein n=1 Tax=Stylosanthes scabra TaxID=79078 RepID=A0ABU6SN63_9FABA|nr:hypothetical protein [Stylosanthes scabra]